ncbi:MAG: fmt, methionyl-tRNA formyltransferase, methionyl-tRNA formyltransferase [Candidatus Dadabacteria bacterium CSP1-2]|nr:MAG: fmt, methionyl-tRNA formyltransferase, methionyl-tRNA formyltransferase [Candidatus Dadabacteria bacterium CSP1-2]
MKIIFMGTPEFAVPSLRALVDSGDEVVAVVTQPDKPKGRGLEVAPPPTKVLAERHGIPVLQPAKIKTEEFFNELKKFNPDLICVAAYGKILPKNILDLPHYGCINVHASLLPKYRGAAPINWAIIRGEKVTGITTMKMDEGMDTGDMLLKKEVPIEDEDTGETLSEKLSEIGARLLIETIRLLKEGQLNPIPQDHSQANYAPMLKKEDGKIDWQKSAEEIRNLIRGALPWPSAYTNLEGKLLKIYKVRLAGGEGKPGEVIKSESGILRVATGKGALDILKLQIEGGKKLETQVFLRGRRIEEGMVLGD